MKYRYYINPNTGTVYKRGSNGVRYFFSSTYRMWVILRHSPGEASLRRLKELSEEEVTLMILNNEL